MTHSQQLPPLFTERLVLRELEDSDFASVHAYATDPLVVRFMPWGPNSESDTSEFLKRAQDSARTQPRVGYELAIILRDGDTLLGAIGLHHAEATAPELMLGYCLAQSAWGHGYATEAGVAMIRFGFVSLGLECIWAGCDTENAASIKVIEKLGMTLESRHQHDADVRGESHDSLMYRLRSNEWRDGQTRRGDDGS